MDMISVMMFSNLRHKDTRRSIRCVVLGCNPAHTCANTTGQRMCTPRSANTIELGAASTFVNTQCHRHVVDEKTVALADGPDFPQFVFEAPQEGPRFQHVNVLRPIEPPGSKDFPAGLDKELFRDSIEGILNGGSGRGGLGEDVIVNASANRIITEHRSTRKPSKIIFESPTFSICNSTLNNISGNIAAARTETILASIGANQLIIPLTPTVTEA